ncbi:hypothetical protein AOQ84DRAFT_351985 [Glonium stellatum]|uniref:Uncharacterized protein n=1 Tax=Glonium stellatum TaxID=574774 RepID=A0A8E2FBA6_9PEZI|nr:hypothetical protein AOQ84DRAFT_351985 [Glonium stellatum]
MTSPPELTDTNHEKSDQSSMHRLPSPEPGFPVRIIWHNIYAESDFSCFQRESTDPTEQVLVKFGEAVKTGVFDEIVSVAASRHLLCVTVICTKLWDEIKHGVFLV